MLCLVLAFLCEPRYPVHIFILFIYLFIYFFFVAAACTYCKNLCWEEALNQKHKHEEKGPERAQRETCSISTSGYYLCHM